MKKVVIVSACRTAIGAFGGTLKDVPAAELGALVVKEAVSRAGIKPEQVDEAVKLLISSRQVYIFAPDVSKGLGNILQYRLLRLGILLIPLPGGSQLYDAMVNLKQGDLVLLFGYSRLLTEVQILLSYSEKAGYQTILFTDLLAEEHLSNANLTLYSFRGEPNDYHSVATPLLLIDLLIMKASQSLGGGLEKAKKLQNLREQYAGLIRR